jgi:Fic family protein
VTVIEVLNNVEAMSWAVEHLSDQASVSVSDLLAVHEPLLVGTRLEQHGGRVREVQNWIGGSGYNPCSAAFVPPPPELVEELLEDLCEFCSDDEIPAVAQAAIATPSLRRSTRSSTATAAQGGH